MTANKEMISTFLANSRSSNLSGDKRSRTITWDCTPGKVFYNYVIPGGSTQRKGYYNHEGIYRRQSDGTYKKAGIRYNLFEGIKCTKIQYRKNGGTWSTISDSKGISSTNLKRTFTSTKNGDVFEIKATYQVWTMGSPFRNVPFMWFGTKTGLYNNGANRFSQSAPANPGRGWSGMNNYEKNNNGGTDKNSSWKIVNYSWYQPNSTSINTNWSYLHAKNYYAGTNLESGGKKTTSNGWLSTYSCEKWLSGMPYGTNMGWTGNVSGIAPQNTRKSSWWTFEKTFTDSFTVSGVVEKPDPLSNPTVSLTVINNLTTKDSNGKLNGIAGNVQITYRQSNNVDGRYKIYAYQQIDDKQVSTLVATGSIGNNRTQTINIDFTKFDSLKRSKNIAYYAIAETQDSEYNTVRNGKSANSTMWTELIKSGTHYYNDEPLYSSNFYADKDDTSIKLNWNVCSDSDGHAVSYRIYICRDISKYSTNKTTTIRIKNNSNAGYTTKTVPFHDSYNTTSTSYTIDTSMYEVGETLNIYMVPHDDYYNDYYYGNSLNETAGPNAEVFLTVIDNMTVKNADSKLDGDRGTLTYKYTHRENLNADIDIYMYMSDGTLDKSTGSYFKKLRTDTNVSSGTSKTITVNFGIEEVKRGRYIKYFAIAKDTAGEYSSRPYAYNNSSMWVAAKGYHYYNSVPTAVSPFITEVIDSNMYDDNIVEIAWASSTDKEKHTIYYKLYIQAEGNTPYSETFYVNRIDNPQTLKYTKCIDLGSSTLPTAYNPYELDVSDYIGKKVCIWIKTYDKYNASRYLIGNVLDLGNPGTAPDVPEIEVEYAYAKDLYGEDKVDSENGYISISYSHPAGRNGGLYLHAICKKPDGTMEAFKNIAYFDSMSSGGWTPKTKLNFPLIFTDTPGEPSNEWRTSEIRYYATAVTDEGEWSVPEGINWEPDISMWDSWKGVHKFNEEPGDVVAKINHDKCNLHDNIFVEWNAANDPDDNLAPPIYTVVLSVKEDVRAYLTFVQGVDGSNVSEIISYTEMWDTVNTAIDIDISAWEGVKNKAPGEYDFDIRIIPHDDYANSYYYMTKVSTDKIKYGKPKPEITVIPQYDDEDKGLFGSEYGELEIKYDHEDLDFVDGQYISKDPEHRLPERGDFDGIVDIYCYIDDVYSYNYSILNEEFKPGDEKTFTIDFSEVSPYSRSHEIRYYVVATDKLTGVRNNDTEPEDAESKDLTDILHYYNDEPFDPDIRAGELLNQDDKKVYGFTYLDVVWDTPYEPDGDSCMYYVYIKTPASMDEEIRTVNLTNRDYEPIAFDYTRKYRIKEVFDECIVEYLNENDEYIQLEDQYEENKNPFIGIRLNFENDHLGKEWPDNEEFEVLVEARDNRTSYGNSYGNSYYGVSNVFKSARKKHEPPYEVKIEVTHNLTDGIGNGEHGKMMVTYTHPEPEMEADVTIYAYQDNKLICDICTKRFINGAPPQPVEYDFNEFPALKRSKYITYYAVAEDTLVHMSSLDRVFEGMDSKDKLNYIPYLPADSNGEYGSFIIITEDGEYDYNVDNHYKGPVRKGLHYYNEEPPATTPEEYDKDNIISYKSAEIKWPHVVDPDGHDVSYEIYIAGTDGDKYMNTNIGKFYGDIPEPEKDTLLAEEAEIEDVKTTVENTAVIPNGDLEYHKMVSIPASLAQQASEHFSLSTEEYSEDTTINIWIVSKDQYTNSYYRNGEILSISKGHNAKDIRETYPRNGSTVYATQPRILIYLGEDNQTQTVYVGWKEKEYNNRDNPELFSSPPNKNNVIVFKPPTPYTTLSGTKVSYYVYSHNQCSYSDKKYVTYTYKDFFDSFTDKKLIAIKADHINQFRKAIDITRDAYGLSTANYTRTIQKNMIFENFDFNETKNAICEVNDLLNNADTTEGLDYVNPLIVNIKDLDIVECEGLIGTTSYNEFLEWARLVYILQNL